MEKQFLSFQLCILFPNTRNFNIIVCFPKRRWCQSSCIFVISTLFLEQHARQQSLRSSSCSHICHLLYIIYTCTCIHIFSKCVAAQGMLHIEHGQLSLPINTFCDIVRANWFTRTTPKPHSCLNVLLLCTKCFWFWQIISLSGKLAFFSLSNITNCYS